MYKKFLRTIGITTLLLLVACAGPTPLVSKEQIDDAIRHNTLAKLYERTYAQWSNLEPTSSKAKNIRHSLDVIGQRLAEDLEKDIVQRLNTQNLQNNQSSLFALDGTLARLQPMKKWQQTRHDRLLKQYQQQLVQGRVVADEKRKRLSKLTDLQAFSKAALMHELAMLYGGPQGAKYSERRTDYIEDIYQQGVRAIDSKLLLEASKLLADVKKIMPDYPGLEEQLLLLESGAFEDKFWHALGSGRPDEAYQLFYEASSSAGFNLVKQQIGDTASDISDYFIALGKKQTEQGLYAEAFLAYQRARYIRQKLELNIGLSKEEKNFVLKMEQSFQKHFKNDNVPFALGFLISIEEMAPQHQSVKKHKRVLVEKALEKAAVKISTTAFSSSDQNSAFGRGLPSKVSLYLLTKIPEDLRIIERDRFAALYGKAEQPDTHTYLSYYNIEGEILEAEVDTTEKNSNQTKRVVTGEKTLANPDYQKWLDLPKRKKKKIPEPEKTKAIAVQEDVEIKSVIIKKVGVFSAIFRLVDPFTAKVVFVDSVTQKQEHDGVSIEGIELGTFRQESQMSDLPSDSEILNHLASVVAEKIGERLMTQLSVPEQKYEKFARLATEEENLTAVVRNYAYAMVLAQSKSLDTTTYKNQLRHYVLQAGM